jgi:hypothetical protein
MIGVPVELTQPSANPRRPRSGAFLFGCIAALWAAGFGIATLASSDVLEQSALLRKYVAIMAPLADPRGLMGTRSSFPQVTALYYSVICWSAVPWLAIWWRWMVQQIGTNKTDMLFKAHLSLGNRAALLILTPLWLALAYAFIFLNHGGDTRLVAFGTSRIQLGLLGMVFYIGVAGLLAITAFSIKRAIALNKAGGQK